MTQRMLQPRRPAVYFGPTFTPTPERQLRRIVSCFNVGNLASAQRQFRICQPFCTSHRVVSDDPTDAGDERLELPEVEFADMGRGQYWATPVLREPLRDPSPLLVAG